MLLSLTGYSSTVSKVLRQKEKYLFPDDGNRSPIKKSKGKLPDIERALSIWARNNQRQGLPLTDAAIREKALFFASTVGGPEGHQKVLSSSWLEKFKQKNGLTGPKSRKGSVDAVNDLEGGGSGHSNISLTTHTPSGVSPISPNGVTTPSPLSPELHQIRLNKDGSDGLPDCANDFRHSHSQSTTSLESIPSLPANVTSPGTLIFSSENPFTTTSQSRVLNPGSNSSRPRSQTFPMTGTEPGLVSNGSSDHVSPKSALHQSLSTTVLEEDTASTPPSDPGVIKRNRSNPEIKTTSMHPPPLPNSNAVSPISSPGSPTQDEARKALELVMNYFQNQPSGLGAQDYMTIGKLMEKLELAQNQAAALPRGLHRIDEHADVPRVSKKRSIHTL